MAWDTGRKNKTIRLRTTFSKDQLELMEREFAKNDHPDMGVREKISRKLNLTTVQVSIWFKNRRARAKKSDGEDRPRFSRRALGGSEDDDDPVSEDSNSFDESINSSFQTPNMPNQIAPNPMFSPQLQQPTQQAFLPPQPFQQQQPQQPQSFPPLVSPAKQDIPQMNGQQPPSQPAASPAAANFRFVPNPQVPVNNAGVQPNLPATFHQTAWAVIPAQHFAANPTMYGNNQPATSVAAYPAPAPLPPQQQDGSQGNCIVPNGVMPATYPSNEPSFYNSQLNGYQAEREFFGDKYVIQPYIRPEYTGGLRPIHYATDEDGPGC